MDLSITKFIPSMHLGILSDRFENRGHWPWPSRSFDHRFDSRNRIRRCSCTLISAGQEVLHVSNVLLLQPVYTYVAIVMVFFYNGISIIFYSVDIIFQHIVYLIVSVAFEHACVSGIHLLYKEYNTCKWVGWGGVLFNYFHISLIEPNKVCGDLCFRKSDRLLWLIIARPQGNMVATLSVISEHMLWIKPMSTFVKFLSVECHKTSMMMSQRWFGYWLGTVRQCSVHYYLNQFITCWPRSPTPQWFNTTHNILSRDIDRGTLWNFVKVSVTCIQRWRTIISVVSHTKSNRDLNKMARRHFAGDNFKYISFKKKLCMSIRISLKFISSGPMDKSQHWFGADQPTCHPKIYYVTKWWPVWKPRLIS